MPCFLLLRLRNPLPLPPWAPSTFTCSRCRNRLCQPSRSLLLLLLHSDFQRRWPSHLDLQPRTKPKARGREPRALLPPAVNSSRLLSAAPRFTYDLTTFYFLVRVASKHLYWLNLFFILLPPSRKFDTDAMYTTLLDGSITQQTHARRPRAGRSRQRSNSTHYYA